MKSGSQFTYGLRSCKNFTSFVQPLPRAEPELQLIQPGTQPGRLGSANENSNKINITHVILSVDMQCKK